MLVLTQQNKRLFFKSLGWFSGILKVASKNQEAINAADCDGKLKN